jgi:hypothetical protein
MFGTLPSITRHSPGFLLALGTYFVVVLLLGQPYGVVGELRKHNVDKVLVVSYDLYGVLSQELPALKIANGWGAMSRSKNRRYTFLQLLKTHEGHHVLITKPESSTVYDYFPSSRDIQQMQHLENFKLQQL